MSVQFKAISGKRDQGAGIVWRYRDRDDDYITRCNALEVNCTIYHVVNGRRQAFQNQNVKVASGVWHTLRVEADADHFVVAYDGKKVLDARIKRSRRLAKSVCGRKRIPSWRSTSSRSTAGDW